MSSEDETYVASEHEQSYGDESSYVGEDHSFAYSEDPLMQGHVNFEEENVQYEDYNHLFETEETYDTLDDAFAAIKTIGFANNMYFIKSTKRPNRTYVKCHRGKKYHRTPTKEGSKPRESSGSVRISCPFRLVIEINKMTQRWSIRTMPKYGRHNHVLGVEREGYRHASALKPEVVELVLARTVVGVKPVKILEELKSQIDANYSTLQHIYNARQKQRREEMGETPPLVLFFRMLAENGWYSLLMQRTKLIDGVYVEIIGVVPTGQNYHVAFAFVSNEQTETYTWVMHELAMMCDREPAVFVTDREQASMKANKSAFLDAVNLLCRWHIATDVFKYLLKVVKSKEMVKILSGCWDAVVFAKTEQSYELVVADLLIRFEKYPKFIAYLNKTWLEPHRTQFVSAWTDKYLHYGVVTTNRVERAHSQLKHELQSTRGDFHTVWQDINRVVGRQLETIKGEFEKSRSKMIRITKHDSVFCRLAFVVSHKALWLMFEEIRQEWQRTPELCHCALWTSHCLPCMCRILACSARNESIDPKDIDPFWRSLDMEGSKIPTDDDERATGEDLLNESVRNFKQRANDIQMRRMATYLRKETHTEFNNYESTPIPPQKGRPPKATGSRWKSFFEKGFSSKKKEKEANTNEPIRMSTDVPIFIRDHHLPARAREFVTGYRNVAGYGHCGYRATSWWHFSDEKRYDEIRWELRMEMMVHHTFWLNYLDREYQKIWDTLNWHRPGSCGRDYWFSGLEMLPLAATRFQKIIVMFSRSQSLTHLPLRCDYAQNAEWENEEEHMVPPLPEIWFIGYLDTPRNEHYIVLDYQRDALLPPIHPTWRHRCDRN